MSKTFDLNERFGFIPPPESGFFDYSRFGKNWEKNLHNWAESIYGDSNIINKRHIKIADISNKISNSTVSASEKIIKLQSKPYYTFHIYTHPKGSEVLKMYNDPEKIPESDYEVLVFLETDDGKFDFGKIVRVKFGEKVVEDLRYNLFSEWPWNDKDEDDIAEEFIKAVNKLIENKKTEAIKKEVNSIDFKDLMIEAIEFEFDNKKFDDLSWFALIIKADGRYFGNKIFDWTTSLSSWLRTKKYKEDKYWNGDLPEDQYTPAFLPDNIFIQNPKKREESLKVVLNEPYSKLRSLVDERTQGANPIYQMVRSELYRIIDNCQTLTDPFIEDMSSSLYIPEGGFQTYVKHMHAFFVGLWNGVLELIAGLVDLIGLLILIMKEEVGYRITDLLFEKTEEFANLLYYETETFFLKVIEKTKKLFLDFAKWYATYEGKSYYFVKNIAELIPEIVTFIIPILKGSKAAKLGKLGKEAAEESREQIGKNAKQKLDSGEVEDAVNQAKKSADEQLDEAGKDIDDIIELGNKSKYLDNIVDEDILNIPKGQRPDPSKYLVKSYILNHLKKFEKGASYLVPKKALDKYGREIIGRPDGQFVMTKIEMDNLLAKAKGDISIIEKELGIPEGMWKNEALVRIDVDVPKRFNLRIPSGNEAGANELWIPGGILPNGYLEAVIDQIKKNNYKETILNIN